MERSSDEYQVTFIKHQKVADGHVEYLVKVNAPGGHFFHFRDRYSSMRAFQSIVKRNLAVNIFNQIPQFPKKNLFGSTYVMTKAYYIMNDKNIVRRPF
jgi:hypothetical protein